MDVNDYAGILIPRGALKSIASRLAPTGGGDDFLTGIKKRRPLGRRFFYDIKLPD
ncbi:hypothetical protein J2Y74_001707 [Pseudomonas migulae]|nr:hypothetical protein [Pseudomonas migulae]